MEELLSQFGKKLQDGIQVKINQFIKSTLDDTKSEFDKLWETMMNDVYTEKNRAITEKQLAEQRLKELQTVIAELNTTYNTNKLETDQLTSSVNALREENSRTKTEIAKNKAVYNAMLAKEKDIERREKELDEHVKEAESSLAIQKSLIKEREDSIKRISGSLNM